MKRALKRTLFLALALVFLVQLACDTATIGSGIGKVNCEARGGTWRQEVGVDGKVEEWCEMPPTQPTRTSRANDAAPVPTATPPAPAEASAEGDCVASSDAYTWSYQDFRQSSGTGGVTCNAKFILKNTSHEPLYLIVFTAFDNNAMQDSRWKTFQVQPAGE